MVVDANILVSALLQKSVTRKILLGAKQTGLFAPEFIKEELFKYSGEFARRLKVENAKVEEALSMLFEASKIIIVSKEAYSDLLPMALRLCPDKKDAPYFALALKLSCPLWSNDKALKRQSSVIVFSTEEVLKKFWK